MSGWAVKRIADLEKEIESLKAITENNKKNYKNALLTQRGAHNIVSEMKDKEIKDLKAITKLKNEMLQDAEKRIMDVIESRDKLQDITELNKIELSVISGQLELAVKGLKKISNHCAVYRYPILEGITDNVRSEIERLQNGTS